MRVTLMILSVFLVFSETGGENLKDQNEIPNVMLHQNRSEIINCCVVREIIHRIEELLQKQLEKGELKLNSILSAEENSPKVRKIRQNDDTFNFNKCVLKSEMEQHKHAETEHISAVKQELEQLKDLVRLLRDQQQVLNMLTEIDSKAGPKSEDEEDQRKLIKLFRLLKNNLPKEAKSLETPLPPSSSSSGDDMRKVMIEIGKIHQQMEAANRIAEEKLNLELAKHKGRLEELQSEIENLRNGQALFVHLNSSKPDQTELVGARLLKPLTSSLIEKLKPKPSQNKSATHHEHKHPLKDLLTPKIRASSDDFFGSLQQLLDMDSIPDAKEIPFESGFNSNLNVENRLSDLEKQLKISSKIKKLEKKVKELHSASAESKNLDEDDLSDQIKKLQRQLKSISKNKAESKELDEDDILSELKSLQDSINDLRPKDETPQSKIGSAELQIMLNKLIGVPAVPVVPTHPQLSPAQIQILQRVMALKAGHRGGHSQGHGLYSGYSSAPYGGYYGGEGIYNSYNYGRRYPYGYGSGVRNKYGQYGPIGQRLYEVLYGHTNNGYPGVGVEAYGNGYYPLGYAATSEYAPLGEYTIAPKHRPVYKPSPYSSAVDGTKYPNAYYPPASKEYSPGDAHFFRGYENAEAANYQSDASQSYANSQKNSYSGDAYPQQKIGELQGQIYKLQAVIGNLNRPDYVQKPEDQDTIYELDRKISSLKGIVSNLAHPDAYGDEGESGNGSDYDASPKSRSRFRRDLTNVEKANSSAILKDFFQQVDDILSVVNYFTSDKHPKHIADGTNEHQRTVREVKEESPMTHLLNKLYNLADIVDTLGVKVLQLNQTNCTEKANCSTASARRKREADNWESDEDDDKNTFGAIGVVLQHMMGEDDDKNEENKMRKEIHPQTLQDKLDDLKKQLESKMNPSAHPQPQHRSSHNTPDTYYYVPNDSEEYFEDKKFKKSKDKSLKLLAKKESKFDKIFSKILDKILMKIVKKLPIIIQKLIGIEIEKEIYIDGSYDGDGYYGDQYGVQKKKNFGLFGFIPVIIFKLLSNLNYFVKKLKKVPFIKTFLVPGLITVGSAGLVIFLVWWLTGDDYYSNSYEYQSGYKDDYAQGHNYNDGYQNSYGYDNSYRSSNSMRSKPNHFVSGNELKPFVPTRNIVPKTQMRNFRNDRPPIPYPYHSKPNYPNVPVWFTNYY